MFKISQRKNQLEGLLAFLTECETDIFMALKMDLGRPLFEASAVEIGSLRTEINHAIDHLETWAKPKTVSTPLIHQPGKSWIEYQPLGQVLVIAPWNYPFLLTLGPAASAISAGNQVTLKPSELAPQSAQLLAEKLSRYVDINIHTGGPEITQELLNQRWDHIFFTGGARVAQLVYQAAAQHLTPVTLELGGKSPAIIDQDISVELASKRITWGKFLNAGQTCVAPDYALVHKSVFDAFVNEMVSCISKFFGASPKHSPDFGRIVNLLHHRRLQGLLSGGKILTGGDYDESELFFEPTLVTTEADSKHALMQDEIFGPILPIIPFKTSNEAIERVNSKPKPLALYCFSNNKAFQERILNNTQSGGACINDTVSHLGIPGLPFGGVGMSGFGNYHGRFGFERFSHARAVYQRSTQVDLPLRYPPYSKTALKIANWFQ